MTRKLHIANLRFSVRGEELERLFAPYGTVRNARVISNLKTGSPTACGLVEIEGDQDAAAAIAVLNGTEYCRQLLRVGWASPRQESGARVQNVRPDERTLARGTRKCGVGCQKERHR